jgi:hypothetical protein
MEISFSNQVRTNSRKFELVLEKVLENVKVGDVFDKEVQKLLSYLKNLGIGKELSKTIGDQLKYHRFEKFFLGYNSYNLFKGNRSKTTDELIGIICLGELFSIPIIFMDDILDSHYQRNRKPTPYGFFARKYPGKEKEFTLFNSNIILNYLIGELMTKKIDQSLKDSLLKNYVYCANKTYLSPVYEQNFIPRNFEGILDVYKEKSYYFTTYFMSEHGSLLGGGRVEKDSLLEGILLNLTYLLSIKNDLSDLMGKKRGSMEDLLHHSNTLGLYILRKSCKRDYDVNKILERGDKKVILSILNSDENMKEVIKKSVSIRNSILASVEKYDSKKNSWFFNYMLYADFLLKDLLDNLNYVWRLFRTPGS